MMASASESSSKLIAEGSNGVRVPKSMSAGKADGVSSDDDDCGVAPFVVAEDEGEGR
jgi:hypothetical protein